MTAPDERLRCAAGLVRQDAVFADIGTDHAYLPLFLLETGHIRRAICTDIHEGPLENARKNAALTPFGDRMTFLLGDGLDGLGGLGITDVAICGMGGEMIAQIVCRADFVRDGNIRLILQPMTRQEHLRRALAENGFSVLREDYATSEGKHYVTMAAHYTGERHTPTDAACVVGPLPVDPGDKARIGYLEGKRRALRRAVRGKDEGGIDADADRRALAAIDAALSGIIPDETKGDPRT